MKAKTETERNALAELEHELLFALSDIRGECCEASYEAVAKARLIVAELAKAQVADGMARSMTTRANCLEYSFGNEPLRTVGIFTTEHFPKWICSALNAVEKCREIAEKGEKE